MIAGALNERIELLRPSQAESISGSRPAAFGLYRAVHAGRVRLSGSGIIEAGETFADYRAVWRIRDAHPAAPGWRVRACGLVFNIVAVEPNRRRGFLTLICERLNP